MSPSPPITGYGIRFVRLEGTITRPESLLVIPGSWLEWYDPEAFDGRGDARWTLNPRLAMRFVTAAAAMECYRMVSKTRPTRDDGRPNRPLTAFTVSCEPLP